MNITDIHTHRPDAGPGAVINIEPDAGLPAQDASALYSTGVHPWRSTEADVLWPMVQSLAADPRIAAIGECGLDRLRGARLGEQQQLFMLHARLAADVHKPLIIHCVKAWAELLAARRRFSAGERWIVHGFRGSPALARQLLDAGMHISLGEHFRPDTAAVIPPDRLHFETDCSALSIEEIRARIAPYINPGLQTTNHTSP